MKLVATAFVQSSESCSYFAFLGWNSRQQMKANCSSLIAKFEELEKVLRFIWKHWRNWFFSDSQLIFEVTASLVAYWVGLSFTIKAMMSFVKVASEITESK